ncbi:uncharacterized protein LOC126954836 [Macaca thibetana thibetana]|uniref:uncharacterized protein LOC126954836 n=1 Tax=Macaca thibetana thibetana TaxID=257877 RepID=UPI0021BC9DD3|nr:uncharacterized protein LOC126954836 [Macaca thibetana thibetana]
MGLPGPARVQRCLDPKPWFGRLQLCPGECGFCLLPASHKSTGMPGSAAMIWAAASAQWGGAPACSMEQEAWICSWDLGAAPACSVEPEVWVFSCDFSGCSCAQERGGPICSRPESTGMPKSAESSHPNSEGAGLLLVPGSCQFHGACSPGCASLLQLA